MTSKVFKKYWDYFALAAIIILAAAVRLFHFHEWLYFAMDQGRDANLIRKAIDGGISQLPLLGPRAAGTFLRLGPAFYYFQYLSAKISGSTDPAVMAYPDLFLGILSVPLFYFFLRLYFKKPASLAGAALLAANFIAIQNSRFAWNPNSAPFWILFALFGLVKFSRSASEREKMIWLGIAAVGLGFASQMHFLVFVSLPVIMALHIFWSGSWKKLNWKNILPAIAILAVLYIPMALSEWKTSGDNMKQFIFALQNKSSSEYSLKNKFFQNFANHGDGYFNMLTSYSSPSGKFSMLAGLVFITATFLKMVFELRDEKDAGRKNFLKAIFVWFAVIFFLLIPFAFQIRPRFFLPVLFLPIIFSVFWIERLAESKRKKHFARTAAILLFFSVFVLNCTNVFAWYRSLALGKDPISPLAGVTASRKFQNVTVSQIKALADYLRRRSAEEGKTVQLYGNMIYRVPAQYFLEADPALDYSLISKKDKDPNDLYFAIAASEHPFTYSVPEKIYSRFDLVAEHSFGYHLKLFEMKLKAVQPDEERKEKKSDSGSSSPSSQKKKPAPKRTERVKWEDL